MKKRTEGETDGEKEWKIENWLVTKEGIPYNLGQAGAKQVIDQRIMRKYPHLSERLRKYILTVTGAEKNTDDQLMDEKEKFDVKKLRSIKQNYEELCPGIPDRTRQRDFTVLRNIGYPIEYIRRYRYYNAWDSPNFRDNFGLFLEDGILKRRRGGTDHEDQHISAEVIAFRDSWLREMEE